jgi:hypothetical protein
VGETKLNYKFPHSLVLVAVSSSCGLVVGLVPSSCCPVISSLALSGCLVVLGKGGSLELTGTADKGDGIIVGLVPLSRCLIVGVILLTHHPVLPLYPPSPLPFRPSGRLLFCGRNKAKYKFPCCLVLIAVSSSCGSPVVSLSHHLVVGIISLSCRAGRRGTAWNSRPIVAMGASRAVSPD